jgi:gamma-glutamylputrescine oxidase
MLSFWDSTELTTADYIVIGSGIVGLQAAIAIKEKDPKGSVIVFERGILPTGASTKNAGFAATGSLSEWINDSKLMSEQEMIDLFKMRYEGLHFIRQQLGDEAIGYEQSGSHELLQAEEAPILDQLNYFNQLFASIHPHEPIYVQRDEQLKKFDFNTGYFKHCVANTTEGGINSGRLIQALINLSLRLGIQIKTGASINMIQSFDSHVNLSASCPASKEEIEFKCKHVFVCTNAFSNLFFEEAVLSPGRGQVMVTAPLANLKLKGIFHFNEGYSYFRNVGDRLLFGGGRDLAFEEETTTELQLNQKIQDYLFTFAQTHLIPYEQIRVAQKWSGIMAFNPEKQPYLLHKDNRIHGAFCLNGMGVAIGSSLARKMVATVL